MMASPNLASQFSGELVQDMILAIETEFGANSGIVSYLTDLSLATATGAQLDTIGYLIGLPRPGAPTGTFAGDAFFLGTYTTFPVTDYSGGLSSVGESFGGVLSSANPVSGEIIPDALYSAMLTAVAFLKYNGLSFASVDRLCHVFGSSYYINKPKFQFGAVATFPTIDTTHGFSGIGLTTGGTFATLVYSDSDILVTFDPPISGGYLWVLQNAFNIFATSPQVLVSNGA
jgi:hypothetical protein